jgi:hypothetical protein
VVALHPFGLSYYNALVGGLPGAERLGLELTNWGDAVDGVLLDQLAHAAQRGQTAALVPTLHYSQADSNTTLELKNQGIRLVRETEAPRADWLLVFRRTAYWPRDLPGMIGSRPPIAFRARQGVWLSGIWPRANRPPQSGRAAGDPK